MHRKLKAALLGLALFAFILAAYLLHGSFSAKNTTSEAPLPVSSAIEKVQRIDAPNFTVYDASGKVVRRTDFLGKPIVVYFWNSRCADCKQEMPAFNEIYNKEKDSVQFLFIDCVSNEETKQMGLDFLQKQGCSFPAYFDTDEDAVNEFSLEDGQVPAAFFIDRNGRIAAGSPGTISVSTMEKGIVAIKAEP